MFLDTKTKSSNIASRTQRSHFSSGGFTSWASWTVAKNEKTKLNHSKRRFYAAIHDFTSGCFQIQTKRLTKIQFF